MRIILLFLLLLSFGVYSQDSLAVEKIVEEQDSIKPHSIKKALLLSAVIPGAGQIYNHLAMPKGQKKAFWKVPLIYAGLGVTGYYLIKNQRLQKELRTEYQNRLDLLPTDQKWSPYDDQGILTLYNQHLTRRDLFIMGVGLVYLFQLADAGVEAHFVSFDVSEDLTFNLDPVMMDFRTAGFRISLNFR
ncbi:MAG TPA: hypothetical protein EYG86_02535 [Crocinitomicaceae bacterium]|nr:hypothetical protein [Crocinitomicaceae bacterium]